MIELGDGFSQCAEGGPKRVTWYSDYKFSGLGSDRRQIGRWNNMSRQFEVRQVAGVAAFFLGVVIPERHGLISPGNQHCKRGAPRARA